MYCRFSSVSDNPLFQVVIVLKVYNCPSNAQPQFNFRILIFCTCHFWGSSPFFSLLKLVSSSCKSPRFLISALTQGGKSGHLFRVTCSVVLWKHHLFLLQRNTTGICVECSQWMSHRGVDTAHGGMHFLGLSHSGSQVLCEGTVPGGSCISYDFQVQACSKLLSILGLPCMYSPRWAMHLFRVATINLWHSWQIWPIQNTRLSEKAAFSQLGGRCSLCGKFGADPCLLPLAVMHLPLCLQGGRFSLLWYLLGHDSLLCDHTRGHSVALEPSHRKIFVFLFLSLWCSYGLGCYATLVPWVSSGLSTSVKKITDNMASVRLSCPTFSCPLTLCSVNNDIADFVWLCNSCSTVHMHHIVPAWPWVTFVLS